MSCHKVSFDTQFSSNIAGPKIGEKTTDFAVTFCRVFVKDLFHREIFIVQSFSSPSREGDIARKVLNYIRRYYYLNQDRVSLKEKKYLFDLIAVFKLAFIMYLLIIFS